MHESITRILSGDHTLRHRELLRLISQGDEQAFTELFHEYTPKLLPFISKLTRDDYMARELIQETFLRLWIDRAALPAVENPNAWIYRIASNLSLSWLKTQGNRRRILQALPAGNETESADDTMDSKELNLVIQKAVDLLPDRRKEVYRLSREQGLSHQQIAEQLDISLNTVKNQIGQSLKFIQEYINRETGLTLATILVLLGR